MQTEKYLIFDALLAVCETVEEKKILLELGKRAAIREKDFGRAAKIRDSLHFLKNSSN